MVTVDGGSLYFHSTPFRSDLPAKQQILLDKMTANELIDTINGMGYVASVTSEAQNRGLDAHQAFTLLEVYNIKLNTTLTVYTSQLWKALYPIYRVLRDAEHDIDTAVKQLDREMASGSWLDYWASFFGMRREVGENDNNFSRRFTMWLFNPKTNNIALSEFLRYRLQDENIEVNDFGPSTIELVVDRKYSDQRDMITALMRDVKGAGIDYFLSYELLRFSEDYRTYLASVIGIPFEQMGEMRSSVSRNFTEDPFQEPTVATNVQLKGPRFTELFEIIELSNFSSTITLDDSFLDSGEFYDGNPVGEMVSMTMTRGGVVVRSSQY